MYLPPFEGAYYVGAPGYDTEASTVDAPRMSQTKLTYRLERGRPNTMLDQPGFIIAPPMPPHHTPPDQASLDALYVTQPSGGIPTFIPTGIHAASTVHASASRNLNRNRMLLVPPQYYNVNARNPINASNVGDRGKTRTSKAKAPAVQLGGG